MDPSKNDPRENQTRSPRFLALYAVVVGGAVVYLAAARPETDIGWGTLVLIWLLMTLAELITAWLPRGGYSSPASALDFAAILLFGPQLAVWLVVSSALTSQMFLLRRPAVRVGYNASLFTIMVAASGHAYLALGGTPGQLTLPGDLVPVAGAAIVYFLTNAFGISLVISITQRVPVLRILYGNYLSATIQHLSNLAIGATAVLVYLAIGAWGLLLFLLPLLTASLGFRGYFEMKRDLLAFVRALVQVLEEVDPYTREHSIRVSEYSKAVARHLRVRERVVEDIEYGALLHDLGKIGHQYQQILQKPGGLNYEERLAIRAHPDRGADIVQRVRALSRAADFVRCHHERMDGKGYPRGVEAGRLPIGARIITVCDAFDAMTSDRSYRSAMSTQEAMQELYRCCDEQFDREVVVAFDHLLESGSIQLLYEPLVEDERDFPKLQQV